jgi:hypothetical protein
MNLLFHKGRKQFLFALFTMKYVKEEIYIMNREHTELQKNVS